MNYILVTSAAIKKTEDLKGKRIGAAQAGTASYHAEGRNSSEAQGAMPGTVGNPFLAFIIKVYIIYVIRL